MSVTAVPEQRVSAIRRITEGRRRWRVLVRTWREHDLYRGRLVFESDDVLASGSGRESAAVLQGRSLEDVVSDAYDLTDDRLRKVLHSLR
jgi:hypothetical protein